ncbi:hypothetical protein MTO96_034581 [Rhipicephalus appendiculatus]
MGGCCCHRAELGRRGRLLLMFGMTTAFFLVEIIVGYVTNSMALVADSFHMLSDVISLVIAFLSIKMSPKKWSKNTFGWARAEVLGALVNAVFLVALCFSILVESLKRFYKPEVIDEPKLILYVGIAGLIVNMIGLCLFRAIPWTRWIRLFENFLLASGAADLPAPRRRALLLHCQGPEGQRIFDALPTTPTAAQLPTTEPLAAAATSTGEVKDRGVASKQEAAVTSLPDIYDAAREILERHFAGARNIRLERHHFRERRQLHGESIPDFALALRELAASCDFAEQANDNMCDQFVTRVASPQLRSRLLLEGNTLAFDRAVEIALLSERAQLQSEAFSNSVERIARQHPRQYDASERSTHDSRRYSNEARPLYQSRPSLPHARQTSSPSSDTDAADVQYSKNMQACGNCGTRHCEPTACPARGRTCFACGRRGHFMRVCRSSRRARGQRPTHIQEVVPEQDASDVISLLTVHEDKRKGVYIDVVVTPVASSSEPRVAKFLVDTGSAVSIIREQEFRNMFEGVQLTSSALTLLDFQRRKIPVLGQFKASISFKGETAVIAIHVTPGGTSLLGLDAVQALGLHIVGAQLRCLCTAAEASETMSQKTATSAHTDGAVPASPPKFDMPPLLWAKFSHLFSPGLGLAKGVQHQVKMKSSVPPVVQKLRRLPLSLRKPVSDQLQRLLSDDLLAPNRLVSHHLFVVEEVVLQGLEEDINDNRFRIGADAVGRDTAPSSTGGQLNIRGVYLHILADALGSVVVIISSLVIWLTTWEQRYYVDPALSLVMVCLIMKSTSPLLVDSALILLQTVPTHIQIDSLQKKLLQEVEGVLAVHEFHVWQLAGERIIASAHIRCKNLQDYMQIAERVKEFFHNEGIHSTTIQPEFVQLEGQQVPSDDKDCVLDCPSRTNCVAQTCCGPRGKEGVNTPDAPAPTDGTVLRQRPTAELSTPA